MALELKLVNSLEELAKLHAAVEALTRQHAIDPETAFKIDLCLDEVFTNIVRHGYNDPHKHEIMIRFTVVRGFVKIRIQDDGCEFNPMLAPTPDVDQPLEERLPGGLGIHLVRTLMDRVSYRRINGKNNLFLGKKIIKARSDTDGSL